VFRYLFKNIFLLKSTCPKHNPLIFSVSLPVFLKRNRKLILTLSLSTRLPLTFISINETAALDNCLLYHQEIKTVRAETNAATVAVIAVIVIFPIFKPHKSLSIHNNIPCVCKVPKVFSEASQTRYYA